MKSFIQIPRLFLLGLLVFLSCSDDERINPYEQYYGDYEITNFKSNTAVDLNDDGVTSTNLLVSGQGIKPCNFIAAL